jgi:hypothetical protein
MAAVGIGLALALALWLAWERRDAGREAPPAEDVASSQRVVPGAVQGSPALDEPRGVTATRPAGSRAAEHTLLAAQLARALPDSLSAAELQRLAELLLEARDQRGNEPPRIEREIQVRIAEEFERIAGEPMGTVASRLSTPFDTAPRPPREPDPPASTP